MVKDLETKFDYPIAGSLRIGEKSEKNIPKRLDYFTVHEDSHTTKEVVDQFHSIFKNPKELTIKFLSEMPLELNYLRYGKSGLLCKGDGETADTMVEKEWTKCECSKECKYRGTECKLTGRLYFIIKDMDIGGVWRFQTQSYNTIQNILTVINFLKSLGNKLTEREFKISTVEMKSIVDGKTQKYTTVDLKMIKSNCKNSENKSEHEETEPKEKNINDTSITIKNNVSKDTNIAKSNNSKTKNTEVKEEKTEDKTESINNDLDDFEKALTLVEIREETKGTTVIKIATFCKMNNDTIDYLLHPDIEKQVCNYLPGSAILEPEVYEKNNCMILKKFKEFQVIKK